MRTKANRVWGERQREENETGDRPGSGLSPAHQDEKF